jgi:hypothetical protein
VTLTGLIGLGTATLTHRWSVSARAEDRKDDRAEALAVLRREAYVRYLSAQNAVMDSFEALQYDDQWWEQHSSAGPTQRLATHRNSHPDLWSESSQAEYQARLVASADVTEALNIHKNAVIRHILALCEERSYTREASPDDALVAAVKREIGTL